MTDLIEKHDGRLLEIDGELHEVRGRIKGQAVVSLKAPDGTIHEISSEDFRLRVAAGFVLDPQKLDVGIRIPTASDHLEAAFREAVLNMSARLEREGFGWQERHRVMKEHFEGQPEFKARQKPFPGVRAIQKWRKGFLEQSTNALHDKRYLSGNRLPRHSNLFEDIVLDILDLQYKKHDRMTAKAVWQSARAEYLEACDRRQIEPGPHGQKVVNSLIKSLPHGDVVKSRIGGREARKRLIEANRFVKVSQPMERIEIDSTEADVFIIIDDEGNVGRPWVCAAIDCATGMIVGLKVSLTQPTSIVTAMVLKEILTPKDPDFFEQFQIKNRLDTCGRPIQIIADQGSENSGDVIESCVKNACLLLSPNLPGHPEDKPYIERFFKTLNGFLTTLLGATTTREMPNRSRIDKAQKEACLSLDEFIMALQRWRFDAYAVRPRRVVENPLKTLESPKMAWQRLDDEYVIPDPLPPQEVAQLFYGGAAERTLHHYGIEFERVQYASAELSRLRREIGAGEKLAIRYDPTDMRMIGVVNPFTGDTIFVPTKDEEFPAISVEDLRRIRKELAPDLEEFLSADRTIAAIHDQIHHNGIHGTPARKAKKRAARAQEDRRIAEQSLKPLEVENEISARAHSQASQSTTILKSAKPRQALELKPKMPR
ncbi:Mu transposase C-terminal domain-containing protein [Aliiroseovarius crassostreae]|uniref:Mu transposase C-terminal domain-containing protein n=1 Tax=Aliiroseovarius crassostreae TaxID=154981 RepID=UPI0021FB0B99|nr:Mu transposase C-terminal domain-containing protein [Aliiroseovarius crassostreae]UWP89154.1 Mu transposase C-terminal domain-containing protein [Aliiroseovarius crassostreae]